MRKKESEEGPKKKVQRRKPKKKDADGKEIVVKKRQRKGAAVLAQTSPLIPAEPVVTDINIDQIMQQIRALPSIPLREPKVKVQHHLCPPYGSGLLNGENTNSGLKHEYVPLNCL